jgi:hypothetical protein
MHVMCIAGNEPDYMYANQGYNETTHHLAADVSIFGEILKDYPYVIAGEQEMDGWIFVTKLTVFHVKCNDIVSLDVPFIRSSHCGGQRVFLPVWRGTGQRQSTASCHMASLYVAFILHVDEVLQYARTML